MVNGICVHAFCWLSKYSDVSIGVSVRALAKFLGNIATDLNIKQVRNGMQTWNMRYNSLTR